ncbi:MAG: Glycolate oxidase subunit GlcD [Thermoanaerobacterales bacterium 50_218]|nr:MAG: Glycolate oxidase subunit GlcD [Thermoanaerobacterales bacterium 50_218]HAA90220.1 glycolate oxidase subunit GlcD [Peptococcaceae bacterium]
MLQSSVIEEIKRIVGKEHVYTSLEERICYGYDSTPEAFFPDLVVRPATTEEIQKIVKLANHHLFPIIPRGAGTGLSGGSVPVKGGVVLDLTRMNKILEIDEENLVAVVEPGVITYELQQEVEKRGLFYPPDPASLKTSTIGGNVAECAGGPRAFKYGVTRDYVLGLEVVTPTGELLKVGGKTVKSVTGYDLIRLYTGSEGTLGIITKIILRLLPKPEAKKTLMAVYPSLDDAAHTVTMIIKKGIIPATLELMDDLTIRCVENYLHMGLPLDAEAILIMEVDGPAELVEKQAVQVAELCRENGAREVKIAADEKDRDEIWRARRAVSAAVVQIKPTKISEDIAVPRSQIPKMVRRLKEIAARYDLNLVIFGHAGDGNLHPNILCDQNDAEEMERVRKAIAELFKAAVELGGTLTGEHGIGTMKAPYLKYETGDVGYQVMKAIKKALDPNNILNPGKIFLE